LHDAIYDFTGRVDFIAMTDRLYREQKAYGKIEDEKEWFRELSAEIGRNKFLTATASRLRSVPADEQLKALRVFAGDKLNN